jgi:hypothetical protein
MICTAIIIVELIDRHELVGRKTGLLNQSIGIKIEGRLWGFLSLRGCERTGKFSLKAMLLKDRKRIYMFTADYYRERSSIVHYPTTNQHPNI